MRHEAEIKSNAYWLGLLAHLQASSVPRKVNQKYLKLTFPWDLDATGQNLKVY